MNALPPKVITAIKLGEGAREVSDDQIDALDTFALHCLAPHGRKSVREFARAILAAAAQGQEPVKPVRLTRYSTAHDYPYMRESSTGAWVLYEEVLRVTSPPPASEQDAILRQAEPIVAEYVKKNPKHYFGEMPQDPMGAHALLAAIRKHLGDTKE